MRTVVLPDGVRVAVWEQGAGTPVLLLHAWGHLQRRVRRSAAGAGPSGADDELVGPTEADRLAASIPGSRHRRYEGTGHFVLWERPEWVARDIVDFLDRDLVPSPRTSRRQDQVSASACRLSRASR